MDLFPEYMKNSYNLIKRRKISGFKEQTKYLNRHFTKKAYKQQIRP